jgi:hypothetical protein
MLQFARKEVIIMNKINKNQLNAICEKRLSQIQREKFSYGNMSTITAQIQTLATKEARIIVTEVLKELNLYEDDQYRELNFYEDVQ